MQGFWVTNSHSLFVTVMDSDSTDSLITVDGVANCFSHSNCNHWTALQNPIRIVRNENLTDKGGMPLIKA